LLTVPVHLPANSPKHPHFPCAQLDPAEESSDSRHPVLGILRIDEVNSGKGILQLVVHGFQLDLIGKTGNERLGLLDAGLKTSYNRTMTAWARFREVNPAVGNGDQDVAMPQIPVGQTSIFRAEEEGYAVGPADGNQFHSQSPGIGDGLPVRSRTGRCAHHVLVFGQGIHQVSYTSIPKTMSSAEWVAIFRIRVRSQSTGSTMARRSTPMFFAALAAAPIFSG